MSTNRRSRCRYFNDASGLSAYAFPTKVTLPVTATIAPAACGSMLCTQTQYEYYTGSPALFTDVNSVQTAWVFNDPFDRLTQIRSGSNMAQATFAYTDTPLSMSVRSTSDENTLGDNALQGTIAYDGMGRQVTSLQYGDCGYIEVDQSYDSLGRLYQKSNPYRPCASESAQFTTTSYDALNRVTSVAAPDGSTASTNWTGNQSSVTDPAGVNLVNTSDGAGRLTSVTEAGATVTSYRYDPLDDLLGVCHGGSFSGSSCSGSYARSFVYDSLKRLTSASNPELAGAINYHYDSNGNITQKTDPNGNTISYTAYDGLNRLLAKSYTGASTPAVTYCYDASAQTGACASAPNGSGLNLNGRLTMVSNTNSSTTYGQFDNLGNDKLSAQKTSQKYLKF